MNSEIQGNHSCVKRTLGTVTTAKHLQYKLMQYCNLKKQLAIFLERQNSSHVNLHWNKKDLFTFITFSSKGQSP